MTTPSRRLMLHYLLSNHTRRSSFLHQDVSQCLPIGKCKQYHNIPADTIFNQTQPFSLILPGASNTCSARNVTAIEPLIIHPPSYQILDSGMILMKNHISLLDQVEIVNMCHKLGVGPGGFYQPSYRSGSKLRLHMMCFGRNWDPETKYREFYRSDGSEPPPVPYELTSMVETLIQDAQAHLNSREDIPSMSPDICVVNFYTSTGRLGLHQDRDESSYSIRKGLPVVSISIGDSAEFLYGRTRDEDRLSSVLLESGDVLIFGGKSRLVFHGVKTVFPNSAPLPLLQKTMLRPGRLNLTFRQF
ncbi:hypothetical protein QVD17_10339 [Tagetes erecta]|uniref:Fe2OG dioxygenase domain-containing protein n=1 Tax=Tagetes erecta TaxID=13708 RepID=A0AAD8P5U7_TARER|nr:hypothetical protein QVD17_10339 [Tagetes erecta]